jgi:hypothetical protein
MDIVAVLLALVTGLGGAAGFVVDQTARQFLLDYLDHAEVLEVRVESVPNYRLLKGEAERIRVAGRGLALEPFPRIAILELETDPIAVNPSAQPLPELKRPIQAAIRVVIREEDLNTALNTPEMLSQFQGIRADLPLGAEQTNGLVDLKAPKVNFLPENRLQLSAVLAPQNQPDSVDITFTAGLDLEKGRSLRLDSPEFTFGSVRVPDEISQAFLGGLQGVFDLSELDQQGFIVRILKLEVSDDQLEVIGFVRIDSLTPLTEAN